MDNRAADEKAQTDYLSYLVRLWRDTDDRTCWRASLQSPRSGERRAFASPEALFDFLRSRAGLSSEAGGSRIQGHEEEEE